MMFEREDGNGREMKGWMENVALRCANEQGGWKRDCIMITLRKGGWKREGIMISK